MGGRAGRGRTTWLVTGVLVIALLFAACGSGSSSTSKPASSATPSTLGGPSTSTELGAGVTATSIKLGVSLINFNCVEAYTNSIRIGQQAVYGAFIKYVNQHGGVAGRTIIPEFVTFCPIGTATILAACTSLTEDDNVFADIGHVL